ncbi:MAG: CvpA family protein, partial [Candidatus Omnitrophica bacterium]|nr:CvpA family protein [Candidatus Omnitrophota bacterium]
MLPETIQKLNWIDIVVLTIMVRALYIGLKRGFIDEVLHLLAVVVAIFVIFHYTPFFTQFLENKIFFKAPIAKSVTFIFLWLIIALVAKLARDAIHLLFKIEAKSFLDKIGGIAVGVIRGLL